MEKPSTLYLSDLDGTLLDDKGFVSDRTRSGLETLLKEGVHFSVASARSYFSITKIFGDLPFSLPIIEFNGAFVTDYQTGKHLEVNAIEPDLGREVFDRVIKAGQRPFVCSFNGEEDCLHYDELINSGMLWYEKRRRAARDPRLRCTKDLRATMEEQVVSLTVMAQSESRICALRDELSAAYGPRLQLYCYENEYSKGTWWVTIHDERASKHIAMQSLRDRFVPGAAITALGDNVNDIEMLKFADRAIAMENSVPELKEVADEIIGHHHKNAAIEFIQSDVRAGK